MRLQKPKNRRSQHLEMTVLANCEGKDEASQIKCLKARILILFYQFFCSANLCLKSPRKKRCLHIPRSEGDYLKLPNLIFVWLFRKTCVVPKKKFFLRWEAFRDIIQIWIICVGETKCKLSIFWNVFLKNLGKRIRN